MDGKLKDCINWHQLFILAFIYKIYFKNIFSYIGIEHEIDSREESFEFAVFVSIDISLVELVIGAEWVLYFTDEVFPPSHLERLQLLFVERPLNSLEIRLFLKITTRF